MRKFRPIAYRTWAKNLAYDKFLAENRRIESTEKEGVYNTIHIIKQRIIGMDNY